MKEMEVVKLNLDFATLPKGTKGTIVLKYNDQDYEVEFMDDKGETLDVLLTPKRVLDLETSFNDGSNN